MVGLDCLDFKDMEKGLVEVAVVEEAGGEAEGMFGGFITMRRECQ